MDNLKLLELVITNLAEFADLHYVQQLYKLVKDSEYSHLTPVLDKIISYYNKTGIFPSKKYFIKAWKLEDIGDEEFLIEYASEIIAKLRTDIVLNHVRTVVNTEDNSKDLITEIQKCLNKYTPEKVNKNFNEEELASSLRLALKKKKERGAGLLTYTSIDKYTYGCPFGATTVIGAKPKSGKALINGTKILTPTGTIPIEKIKVGDTVIGMDGRPTKVTGVYPQGVKQLYTIKFNDKTCEVCCGEHLWLVHDRKDRLQNKNWKIVDTNKMLEKVKVKSGRNITRANYSIPIVEPIQYTHKKLPLNPYVVGCLIGDGSLSSDNCGLTNTDIDVINRFFGLLPEGYTQGTTNNCTINIIRSNKKLPHFKTITEKLGLNTLSEFKRIPNEYMFADIESRIQLLQGLMDTDGSVNKEGRTQYSYWTTSTQLRDDIITLVRGLSGLAHYRVKPTVCTHKNKKTKCKDTYEVRISFPFNNIIPITCSRKLNNIQKKRKHRVTEKFIQSIEPYGLEECTCITVDNDSHTYVTENFNVTHNSNVSMSVAWGAISKQNLKGIYISLEISAETIYQRLFSRFMYDKGIYIDNQDIIKGTLNEADAKTYDQYLEEFQEFVKGKICVVTQENLPELTKVELETFLLRKDEEMGGIDFVIVDQVSLLKYFTGITTTSGKDKTFDIINAYIRYFTVASYTLFKKPVAMILLCQIKRDYYSTISSRKPIDLDCFAEASEIERSTNIAIVLRLDDQLKQSNLLEMVLVVNRDGDNCVEYVPNIFIPKHCYLGSFGEVEQQDISQTNTSSLLQFMESTSEELDDLFN